MKLSQQSGHLFKYNHSYKTFHQKPGSPDQNTFYFISKLKKNKKNMLHQISLKHL